MRVRTKVTEKLTPMEFAERQGLEPACLVAIAGPLLGVRVEFSDTPITIGRSTEADITIPSAGVSRTHCRLYRDLGRFVIEDLGSTNKTFVNGVAIEKIVLHDADRIKIGDSVFKFFDEGSVEADYQKQLVDLAVLDELTRLSNRRQFLQQIQQEMAEARRLNQSLALVIADLDHFKPINDRYGHLSGDQVLRAFTETVALALPANASAGRLGGEEFGFLLPDTGLIAAVEIANVWRSKAGAIQHQLRPASHEGDAKSETAAVTASFGVAVLQPNMQIPSDFLRVADFKLYEAKSAGRNRVCG